MYIIILNFNNNKIECLDISKKPKKMDTEKYITEILEIDLSNSQFMEMQNKPLINFLN